MLTLLAPPVTADVTRRGLLAGLGAAAALSACGASGSLAPPRTTRTAPSRFGPVEVPVDPQRVVAASDTATANALVLGLPLVGAPGEYSDGANPLPRYQTDAYPDQLAGVTRVTTYPLAAEEIAALDPDLIVGGAREEDHPTLSALAPTYAYTDLVPVDGIVDVPDWRRGLRELGVAVDRSPRAEEFIAAYDERVAILRDRVAARWGVARVAVVNPLADHIGVFGRQYYTPNDVLAVDLGLTLSGAVQGEYRMLSLEQLGLIDADVLFVAVGSVPGTTERNAEELAPYAASALWPRIPAVAAGQVHEFDRSLVYASPLTATAFLDVVETALLPGGTPR